MARATVRRGPALMGKRSWSSGRGSPSEKKWTVSTKGPSSNAPRSSKVNRVSPVPVCPPLSLGGAVPGEEGRPLPYHDGACLTPRHTLHTTLGLAPPTASMLSSPPELQQWRQALHKPAYQILEASGVIGQHHETIDQQVSHGE